MHLWPRPVPLTSHRSLLFVAKCIGITSLWVFAELAYNVYGKGHMLAQHMQSLYDKYGEFVSRMGTTFTMTPQSWRKLYQIFKTMGTTWVWLVLGPYTIESIRDLSTWLLSTENPLFLPPSLCPWCQFGSRMVVSSSFMPVAQNQKSSTTSKWRVNQVFWGMTWWRISRKCAILYWKNSCIQLRMVWWHWDRTSCWT